MGGYIMNKGITPIEQHKKDVNKIIIVSFFIIISLVSSIIYLID
jgi:hypothetical protein